MKFFSPSPASWIFSSSVAGRFSENNKACLPQLAEEVLLWLRAFSSRRRCAFCSASSAERRASSSLAELDEAPFSTEPYPEPSEPEPEEDLPPAHPRNPNRETAITAGPINL